MFFKYFQVVIGILLFAPTAFAKDRYTYDAFQVWTIDGRSGALYCASGKRHPILVLPQRAGNYRAAKIRIQKLKQRLLARPRHHGKIQKEIKKLKTGQTLCAQSKVFRPSVLSGKIVYRDILAPDLNGSAVRGVTVHIYRAASTEEHIASVESVDGSFEIDLASFGSGLYRISFEKGSHIFTLENRTHVPFDVVEIPNRKGDLSVIAMKYSIGAYGLGSVDELTKYPSKSLSPLPFLDFVIPSTKVPYTVYPNCNIDDPNGFCFDGNRSNSKMINMYRLLGTSEFDTKIILNAAFYRTFSTAVGDPNCAAQIAQKTVPMVKLTSGSPEFDWNWKIAACQNLIPIPDMRPGFEKLFSAFSGAPIAAVTLEEEALYFIPGKTDFLDYLYHELSKQFPDQTIVEWYAPNQKPNVPGEGAPNNSNFIIPNIGGRRWMVDQYPMLTAGEADSNGAVAPVNYYPGYMDKMKEKSDWLTGILWLGANLPASVKYNATDIEPNCTYWNEIGWKRLYIMLAANRNRFVPTAFDFHSAGPNLATNDPNDYTSIDMWQMFDPSKPKLYNEAIKQFFEEFRDKTVPYFRSHMYIPEEIPAVRPEWIPGFFGTVCGSNES